MEVHPIFMIGVGKTQDLENLELARKIFVDNDEVLTDSVVSPNFRTSLINYGAIKANTKKYKNEADINVLKESIKKKALEFVGICGYRTDNINAEIAGIWLTEMTSDSSHYPHMHYGFTLSGCYYVDVPENAGSLLFKNTYPIETCLSLNVDNRTALNSQHAMFQPKDGDMFLWKSDLIHEVPFIKFEGIRRTIAFDVLLSIEEA